MNKEYTIFCDLDGVLADFNDGYYKLTKRDIRGKFLTNKWFWDPIDKAGREFWANLNWTIDGKNLWEYIKKYNPKILSAPSMKNDSRVGKHDWVNREIPGTTLLLRSAENKKEFANNTSILIDDRLENINDWIESNGIGILHKNAKNTIKQLKEFGL